MVAETISAKEAFVGLLPTLRQTLQQQGIPVQKLEITHHPLLVKELKQANNPVISNHGILTAIVARGKPVSTIKSLEKQNIMPSMKTSDDPILGETLVNESSNFKPVEYKEEPIPITNRTEEQQTLDSSKVIVNQQMHQPDKINAAKPNVPPPVVPVSQFVPEVSKWMEGVIRTNPESFASTEAEFSLSPEHLGPIQIKITTENGKVTAQIVTDTIFAKEALEVQLPQLRQSLLQKGMLVQKLEILQQNLQSVDFAQSNHSFSQGNSGFSQEQRAYPSTQNGSKKQKDVNKEESVKETVFTTYGGRVPRMTQSNIDFTA